MWGSLRLAPIIGTNIHIQAGKLGAVRGYIADDRLGNWYTIIGTKSYSYYKYNNYYCACILTFMGHKHTTLCTCPSEHLPKSNASNFFISATSSSRNKRIKLKIADIAILKTAPTNPASPL